MVFKHEIIGIKDGGDKNYVDENVSKYGRDKIDVTQSRVFIQTANANISSLDFVCGSTWHP